MPKAKKKHKYSREDIEKMKADIDTFISEKTCKVCLEEDSNRVFLPCGHLVCCKSCSDQIRDCPICRERIIALVKMQRV